MRPPVKVIIAPVTPVPRPIVRPQQIKIKKTLPGTGTGTRSGGSQSASTQTVDVSPTVKQVTRSGGQGVTEIIGSSSSSPIRKSFLHKKEQL